MGPAWETTSAGRPARRGADQAAATRAASVRRRSRRPASRCPCRRAPGRRRGPGRARRSSSNVRPSAIPKSTSCQRSSTSTSTTPGGHAIAAAVSRARRDGLVTISTSRASGRWRARAASRRSPPRARRRPAADRSARNTGDRTRSSRRGGRGRSRSRPCSARPRRPAARRRPPTRRSPSRRGSHGRVEQHDRQGRSGSLPQAQVEVEQRPQAEPLEHDRVARFDARWAAMSRGATPVRAPPHERGRAGDEPIEDDRDPAPRPPPRMTPTSAADLQPADGGEYGRSGPAEVGRVDPERALARLTATLRAGARVVDAGAAARHGGR